MLLLNRQFDLGDELNRSTWNEVFNIVLIFHRDWGTLPDPFYSSFPYAKWIFHQKIKFVKGELLSDQVELLRNNNLLNDIILLSKWNDTFNIFEEYVNIYKQLPNRTCIYNNHHLGEWFSFQRSCFYYNSFSHESYVKMMLVFNRWFVLPEQDEYKFNLTMLNFFVNLYKRYPSKYDFFYRLNLYEWLDIQYQLYLENKLYIEREYDLKEFLYNQNNDILKEKMGIVEWIRVQALKKSMGIIDREVCKLLDNVSPCWHIERRKHQKEIGQTLLKNYYDKFKSYPRYSTVYYGFKLGRWRSNQKRSLK